MALLTFASLSFKGENWNAVHWGGAGAAVVACTPAYTPDLAFDTDHLVWDNVQTVKHISVRTKNSVTTCVDFAHRHAITDREMAASNGVYVADDVVWRLPSATATVKPKPRDTIEDAEGTIWTILEVGRIVGTKRYRCIARDLVIHNDLDDLIDIQTPTITYDASGVKTKTWVLLHEGLSARLQPITSDIVDERGVRGFRTTHQVFLSQEVSVTNEDRVSFGGRFYEIRSYEKPELITDLPVLNVELVP
jgi:head-tail adaptor